MLGLWRRLRQSDTIEVLLDANAAQSERITELSTKLLAAQIEIKDWIVENDRLREIISRDWMRAPPSRSGVRVVGGRDG